MGQLLNTQENKSVTSFELLKQNVLENNKFMYDIEFEFI